MRNILIAILARVSTNVLFLFSPFLAAYLTPVEAQGWRVLLYDEFEDSKSMRNWHTRYIYSNGTLDKLNDEEQVYRDNDNHVFQDGKLWLTARLRAAGDGKSRIESGMVRSKFTFKYGYVEARVKLPSSRGVWPAFWLNSDYGPGRRLEWPPEIDIFEYVVNGSTELPNMIHINAIYPNKEERDSSWIYSHPSFNRKWDYFRSNDNLSKDWQTISLLWTPKTISGYLNGVLLVKRNYKWVYKDGTQAGPAHILLNLAIGGKWAGRNGVDLSALPQKFGIDYVLVCNLEMLSESESQCGRSLYAPNPISVISDYK